MYQMPSKIPPLKFIRIRVKENGHQVGPDVPFLLEPSTDDLTLWQSDGTVLLLLHIAEDGAMELNILPEGDNTDRPVRYEKLRIEQTTFPKGRN